MHADRRQRDIPGEFREWARGVASIDRSVCTTIDQNRPPSSTGAYPLSTC